MFITLMSSVKVELQGCQLSCYEVFKSILKNEDVTVLQGPFEEPYRSFEELPPQL